ncbi:unnamed protein product [Litomosoides sigmodontis]|uniref:Tectonin beta-propeller repeat-containing protein 2 n=1 Tax=Litomosoides sigmodontis TaxID=42156 RepID=A0A3P6S6J5_LITSI|nr:unnamed protein product [Litomosoides sigmodontis]
MKSGVGFWLVFYAEWFCMVYGWGHSEVRDAYGCRQLKLQLMTSNDCEENAEGDEHEENDGSVANVLGYFSHVDECRALTEQVPAKGSSGTLKTILTCFDVGHNYIAFGSNCGTLFLFNRRINRSATPLRTNNDDPITCVKLFSGECDLLAAGHSSGGLAILNFPTGNPGSTRRLERTMSFDGHKGHTISCIAWAENGKKVFSADDSGIVVVTSIDFIHNVFQTTFVSLEHSRVIQLTYACNFLALCTVKRVAVIDSFFDSVLEIDQHEQKAIGIHVIADSCGAELLVLHSDGFIIIYDISRGENKRSFSISEDITQKMERANFSTTCRQELWKCMLAVHSQILIVYLYNCIVLLNYKNLTTTLSSFDVNSLFHGSNFEISICVDPQFPYPTIYILGPHNRVFRLSSDEVPSYLTDAREVPKESTSNIFLTSFQKTTKLLPSASKNVFLDGLKVAKEMNIFSALRNFPRSAFSGVPNLNCVLHDNSCDPLCDQLLGSDADRNKSSIAAHEDKNNQLQTQQSNIIENVNKVARALVDRVGGFGTQVEDGFPVQPVYDFCTVDVEETLFPIEQTGILQEIMVRRTKTVPTSKRKKAGKMNGIDGQSLMDSSKESLNPLDEHTLESIKGALTVHLRSDKLNSCADSGFDDGTIEQTACFSEAKQEVLRSREVHNYIEQGKEENITDSSEIARKGNAYEFLMKDALEKKPSVFEKTTANAVCCPNDEQLIKDIVVLSNFSDTWDEIKLPFSCSSFSVSAHCLIVCHSKKKRKPCYLLIPYCGTPHWVKLKQKADHFVINDNGVLVWKIVKNVAFAPVEGSNGLDSFLATTHWTVVAAEGGGIIEVALTRCSAWYITKSGEVFVQLCLPEMGILSRCETSWPLHCITASELAVWALQVESGRLVVRTGLKYSPVGLDWVEVVPYGPTRLISICLYGESGWAIDEKRSLWFTNGVGYQSPFGSTGSWMKVCLNLLWLICLKVYNPWDVSPDINRLLALPWVIRVSSAGVFVCVDRKCYWSGNSVLSGHRLEHIVRDKLSVDNNFELIAGGGLKEDFDCLTLCRINEIFLYRLKNNYFYSLPAFPSSFSSNIIEISCFDESVYVLDSSGCIYVKENINTFSPFGIDWKILDTGPCGSPIISFTVTSISLWVVTAASEAYLYLKSGKNKPLIGASPTWLSAKALNGCVFDKIRASSNGLYVWIFSKSSGLAWVRNSVTEMLPAGKSWTEANNELGIYDLAVGCKIIWSLSVSGQLHRLQGLAIYNRTGNYWKPIPLYLKTIALDRKERLWGIDLNGRLVSHKLSF